MRVTLCLLALTLSGCVPVGHGRHLVIGIGIFSVAQTNQVTVVESKGIGIQAGNGRFNLGASESIITHIPTNSNAVLEIHR